MFYDKPCLCNYWVTHRCNSKCIYCNVWRNNNLYNVPDVKFEVAKTNLVDLKRLGVKVVDFTGGEPLLNKDLPRILKFARDLGFFIQLSNNGSIYPKVAENIKNLVSQIGFSLDTLDPDKYKKIRGIDNFDNLMKSIDIAKGFKENIVIICTVTDNTIDNVPELVEFCKNKKITIFLHPVFKYFDENTLSKKNVKKIKKFFWHPYVRIDLSDLKYYVNGGNNIKNTRCKAGKTVFAITPDNCLFVPCFHKVIKKIEIKGSLFDLYNSNNWKNLYAGAGKYEFCQGCNLPCYLGASPLDKIDRYFFQEILSYSKVVVERYRKK